MSKKKDSERNICPHCGANHSKTKAAPFCDHMCRICHERNNGKKCGKCDYTCRD